MASAKKCDRCGALYEMRELTDIEKLANLMCYEPHRTMLEQIKAVIDLCPECERFLENWLKDGGASDG